MESQAVSIAVLRGPAPARSGATSSHGGNAFDFIRVAAALAVLYSHSRGLYGLPQPMLFGDTLGTLAVAVFFSVSGYLICQSWDHDADIGRFAARRALRILPGLFVAVAFTAFVAGAIDTTLPLADYFSAPGTWRYFASNAALVVGVATLPGAFDNLPHPGPANGSLWTLTYEVLMYAALSLLGLSRHLKVLCLAVFLSCAAAWAVAQAHHVADYALPIPGAWRIGLALDGYRIAYLGAYFFGGSVLYLFAQRIRLLPSVAVLGVLAASIAPAGVAALVLAAAVPYVTTVLARRLPSGATNLRGWDLSYGIYVYAYPIQQLVSRYGTVHGLAWPAALAIETVLVVAAAALSWVAIEKPALGLKARMVSRRRTAA